MSSFYDYLRPRLEASGYKAQQTAKDLFVRTPDDSAQAWICYLDAPVEAEQIRRCFQVVGFHILFVVDEKLIPQEIVSRTETPMWLRVLHGLYMGRIYTWNGRNLFGLHFDYDTGDISESGAIQPDELLLVETGTWLRGWTDIYKLARFYDRAWWVEQPESFHSQYERYKQEQAHTKQQRNGYDEWQQRQRENEYTYNQYQQRYGSSDQSAPPKSTPPPKAASQRDFMREFAQAGSPSAVKALFRKLAKEFHPDLNPGVDTTETMQAINRAYERWK